VLERLRQIVSEDEPHLRERGGERSGRQGKDFAIGA
jgi:hypothetical protein